MGACSSCLNPDRHKHAHAHDNEEEALLNGDTNAQYGSLSAGDGGFATAAERARARVREAEPDPEVLKREREEMDRICQGLARKLIDVSAPSRARAVQEDSNGTATDKAVATAPARVNYATLLDATFGVVPGAAESLIARSSNAPSSTDLDGAPAVAAEDQDEDATTDSNQKDDEQDQKILEAQKRWLRDIMQADTEERRWDWTTVRGIDGPLTMSFDDF